MSTDTQARADLVRIFSAGLDAVEPAGLTAMALHGTLRGAEAVPDIVAPARRIFVLALGKAAPGMMAAAEQHLEGRIADAIAVVPAADSATGGLHAARVYPASHPLPDASSVAAANAAVAMLENLTPDDLLIVLLSG